MKGYQKIHGSLFSGIQIIFNTTNHWFYYKIAKILAVSKLNETESQWTEKIGFS